MQRKLGTVLVASLALLMVGSPAFAQLGIFEKTADWGDDNSPPIRGTYKAAGSVSVSNDVYTLMGNGDDIWENNDEGFFVYKELSGSWSLSGKAKWIDRGGDSDWAKVGVMLRENGDSATSKHYWIELRSGADTANLGDQTAAQWRATDGGGSSSANATDADGEIVSDPGDGLWLRVSRLADAGLVVSQYSYDGTTWEFAHAQAMTFEDTIAYGLTITNHVDNEELAQATMSDVKLEQTVPAVGIRSLSLDDPVYVGGDPITVSIKVGGGSGAVAVEETPPAGWTISGVSDGGAAADGVVTWSLSAAKTVTYVVTPPAGSADPASFSGNVDGVPIQGSSSLSAPAPIEIFDHHLDVGAVEGAGDAEYLADEERYWVMGSGADIWGNADQFHFVYKKLTGAFQIDALVFAYNDTSANEWSKAGLMVRNNLTAGSAHLMTIFRGSDNQYDTQWRPSQDSASSDTGLKSGVTGDVRLVRSGQVVSAYYMDGDGEWVEDTVQTIELTDPVYLGLCVTSHENPNFAVGEYDYLTLTLFPFQVAKSTSVDEVVAGGSVDVSVEIEIREGQTTNLTVEEAYSPGVTVSNLSASVGEAADDGAGNISWTASGASGMATLNFTLNVPADYADPFVSVTGSYDDGKGYAGSTGVATLAVAAENLGIFQGHQDIGAPGAPGNVKVDGDNYQVIGSGHDIWDAADDFHFLWMRAEGDFTFSVDDPYIGSVGANPSTNEWQKMGVMVRQELTAPSAYVYGCIRSSDQALMIQWRESSGAGAAWTDGSQITAAEWNPNYDAALSDGVTNPAEDQYARGGTVKMTREGDIFTLWYVWDNEDWYQNEFELAMTDPVYVGVAVTSHTTGATSQGLFANPQFDGSAVGVKRWMLY